MNKRQKSGFKSKKEGHRFERILAESIGYNTDGRSKTKVDIYGNGNYISVKNPSGKHTQISLTTQDKFINAFNPSDEIVSFIRSFFGGDDFSDYPRHRKTLSQIDDSLSQKFINFLNDNSKKLYEYIITKGHGMEGEVNYLAFASEKNKIDSVFYVNLDEFYNKFKKGKWSFNETTVNFHIDGKKFLHLQMKGSGKKYSNAYHSLQFHVYNIFKEKDKKINIL